MSVAGIGFRVRGLGFGVQDSGFRDLGLDPPCQSRPCPAAEECRLFACSSPACVQYAELPCCQAPGYCPKHESISPVRSYLPAGWQAV